MSRPYLKKTPPAPTPLGRYRLLSPLANIYVSPICLGGMSIGTAWEGMGAMDRDSSFKLLDAFFDAGGNFIDTSRNYQNGTSEEIIGEWMESRGCRDQIVLATKFSSPWKAHDSTVKQKAAYCGNGPKSLHLAVGASLSSLRTTYIDLFYVHWYDYNSSVPELMNSLHNLVTSGKVLHIGISDSPAWFVSMCNQYAIDHGKTPFSIYQGQWNLTKRDFEREIIPMARKLGLALAPWDVLGGGRFRTDAEEEAREKASDGERTGFTQDGQWKRNGNERKISHALEMVAKEVGASNIQAVAIAYHLQKTPYVFPIIGGRKVENIQKNIEALKIVLSKEHITLLESTLDFNPGFPNWLIGDGTDAVGMIAASFEQDMWPLPEAIRPNAA